MHGVWQLRAYYNFIRAQVSSPLSAADVLLAFTGVRACLSYTIELCDYTLYNYMAAACQLKSLSLLEKGKWYVRSYV